MQPIAYDLLTTPVPGASIPLLIGGIIAVVGSSALMVRSGKDWSIVLGLLVAMTGTVGAVVGGLNLLEGPRPDYEARRDLISTQIEDSYGIELTEDQVGELEYPAEASERDFERYGSVTISEQLEGADFLERKIYLVWADDSLQLSQSVDGENFEQLDRKD